MSEKTMRNLSKVLIITSFFLFATATVLKIERKHKLEQLEVVVSEENNINVETPDIEEPTTEVVENEKNPDKDKDTPKEDTSKTTKNSDTKKPDTSKNTNTNTTKDTNTTTTKPKQKQTPVITPTPTHKPTVEETNNNLRVSLEKKYNLKIKYGTETDGYTVGGMGVTSITKTSQITKALKDLKVALTYYPSGLYSEVTASYPLTIYLINKYSITNVTGVTDSTNRNVKLSIATAYPFSDSFHHETYHYLELYMKNRGMNYSSWDSLNPSNFKYGTANDDLSYANTFSSNSYFVNNYAQSSQEEDRASTFEYMMANSKASCLNNGKPIYKKAKYMADTMDFFIDACSSSVTERWERYL